MSDGPRPTAPPPLLRRGSRGPEVTALRELVWSGVTASERDRADHGRRPAPGQVDDLDDLFDDHLDRAVRGFQQHRGLIVDGLVGRATQAALEAARWQLGDRLLRHTPGHLQRGDDVEQLQQRLLGLGFAPGRVDGKFGPDTEQAVRRFQRGCGLCPDGAVGPATLHALDGLRRSVSGGEPGALRDREQVRRSGQSLAGRLVVLDPGHGGPDPGARAGEVTEAALVLDLARRIEGRLTAHGVTVRFTRTEHTEGGSEEDRAQVANDCRADLVLSLHCDSTEHRAASGVATFYYGHRGLGTWSAVGQQLADLVQRETVARTGLADCRSHGRTWPLLQATRMPAVRIEAGYLSNPDDAARLSRPDVRDAIAEGVVVAVQRLYLQDDDVATTGLLQLGELRRVLERMTG